MIKTVDSISTVYPNQYYEQTGSTTTKYIFAGSDLVAYIENDGATTTTHYVHPDHLGSTQIVTDESGAVELTKDYYPFGSSRVDSGDASLSRGYIGQFEDGDDMSYLNARYYKSDRGQFMSQDPVFLAVGNGAEIKARTGFDMLTVLSDPQQLNSYAYARNNPIRYKDPTGNLSWEALLSNPVGSLQHVAGWGAFSLLGNVTNRPFAASLLRHSASLSPSPVLNIDSSNQGQYGNPIDQIMQTEQYKSYIQTTIQGAQNGKMANSAHFEFEGRSDLYYALHGVNIESQVTRENGEWVVDSTVSDRYDFNKTNPKTYTGTAIKAPATQAYKDQDSGVLSNYDVKIKVNDRIKE